MAPTTTKQHYQRHAPTSLTTTLFNHALGPPHYRRHHVATRRPPATPSGTFLNPRKSLTQHSTTIKPSPTKVSSLGLISLRLGPHNGESCPPTPPSATLRPDLPTPHLSPFHYRCSPMRFHHRPHRTPTPNTTSTTSTPTHPLQSHTSQLRRILRRWATQHPAIALSVSRLPITEAPYHFMLATPSVENTPDPPSVAPAPPIGGPPVGTIVYVVSAIPASRRRAKVAD